MNASYRGATKGRQASQNKGIVNRFKESTADAGCRLPIQDDPLSISTLLNELLLNFIVAWRDRGENESENSQNTD